MTFKREGEREREEQEMKEIEWDDETRWGKIKTEGKEKNCVYRLMIKQIHNSGNLWNLTIELKKDDN